MIIFDDTTFDIPIGNCIDLECGMGMWKVHVEFISNKGNELKFCFVTYLLREKKILFFKYQNFGETK
jgi:hypothetical protein